MPLPNIDDDLFQDDEDPKPEEVPATQKNKKGEEKTEQKEGNESRGKEGQDPFKLRFRQRYEI
jgi:hypothetical protein